MAPACRYCRQALAAAGAVSLVLFSAAVHAEETAALRLLRTIQTLQAQHGNLAPEILPSLLELGELYAAGQCDRALEILDLALEVSRRADGLLNTGQLQIYDSLIHCYITLNEPAWLKRAQQYVLLIHEAEFGPRDVRLLPALERLAARYEEVGLYLSARRLYRRAIDIGTRTTNDNAGSDLTLVEPLRGMARAFRLEYAYGLAAPDVADLEFENGDLTSRATFLDSGNHLDSLGERSLKRALAILHSNPAADPATRATVLLELGDWYQLAGDRRNADRLYRELARDIAAAPQLADTWRVGEPLASPAALMARPAAGGTFLRRPHGDNEPYRKYTIRMQYTVTHEGVATDVTVAESNAPIQYEREAMEDLRHTRFRPRYEGGQPVDTTHQFHSANIYVRDTRHDTMAAR